VREALKEAGVESSLAEELIVADGRLGYRVGVAVRVV
jgi:hypothetical protein